jgi:hydrogenase expression/formation protein HypD
VENQYVRSVTREGNTAARARMFEVFEIGDRKWRGIGPIAAPGYRLRPEYAAFDAERLFPLPIASIDEPAECIAATVLQGLAKPLACPAFGTRCTPQSPLGAPMVSSEGACAAYYNFRRTL